MNYLAHFLVDHISGDHDFNTGLLLPDITRGLIKTFRTALPPEFSKFQMRLYAGCLKHYESDGLFHGSYFFKKYQSHVNEALKAGGFSEGFNRKWFISHVLMELFIDRVIVKELPGTVDDFYKSLRLVNEKELNSYLLFFGIGNIDVFLKNFDHFRSVKYIYYYSDNNKFIYSLNRIMTRAGLKAITSGDEAILNEVIIDLENGIFGNPDQLLVELNAIFK